MLPNIHSVLLSKHSVAGQKRDGKDGNGKTVKAEKKAEKKPEKKEEEKKGEKKAVKKVRCISLPALSWLFDRIPRRCGFIRARTPLPPPPPQPAVTKPKEDEEEDEAEVEEAAPKKASGKGKK